MSTVIEAIEALRLPHLVVDGDCWYSCALAVHEDGTSACCNDEERKRGICTCGADRYNAQIDTLLSLIDRVEATDTTTLDAAWAEAEAALPDGWAFRCGSRGLDGYRAVAFLTHAPTEAEMRATPDVTGYGPSPVAALRSLAERLAQAQLAPTDRHQQPT